MPRFGRFSQNRSHYTELLSYLNSDNFCSIPFKPFWLPQLPVTGEKALSSTKKNLAGVIFVILANKYGTTYLPQLLPSITVASLVLLFSLSGYQWHLTTDGRHLAAPQNDEVFQIMFGKGFQCHSNRSQ